MSIKPIFIVGVAALLASCAIPPVLNAEKRAPIVVAADAKPNPLQLSKVLTRIPIGEAVVKVQYGWVCMPGMVMGWPGGRLAVSDQLLAEAFKKELEQHRYVVAGESDSVFEAPVRDPSQLLVGAVINKVDANVCIPFSGSPTLSAGITDLAKGAAFMRVTWELYSPAEQKVVYKTTTEGVFESAETVRGGLHGFLVKAFVANVNNLAADPEFHRQVTTPRRLPSAAPAGTGV
jgi:serine protease Do